MLRLEAVGNLTQIEQREAASGKAYITFSVATHRKNRKTGEKETIFVSCTAFGRIAENLLRYAKKGDRIFVGGAAEAGIFTKRDGTTAVDLRVTIDCVEMLNNPERQDEAGDDDAYGYNPAEPVSGRSMDPMAQYTDATGIELPF